jgi:DnaJ like chaperone protein
MTPSEIGVILFGLLAGYWAVSKLFFRPPRKGPAPNPAPPPNPAPAWSRVLQVAPTASAAEIRDAYKHLISKYHPDKVDSLGQELKDLAGQKTQEINAAYRDGMRARGLDP